MAITAGLPVRQSVDDFSAQFEINPGSDEESRMRNARITIAQVLLWADSHKSRSGQWPNYQSGAVCDGPAGLTWRIINNALRFGRRSLQGGSSLALVLAEHRGHNAKKTRKRGRRNGALSRQQAVSLRLQGMAYEEIAERLGVNEQTIHQWLGSGGRLSNRTGEAAPERTGGLESASFPANGARLRSNAEGIAVLTQEKFRALAFLLGVNATLDALGIERTGENLVKVLDIVREFADGTRLAKLSAAEKAVYGQRFAGPAREQEIVKEHACLAGKVWQLLAGCVFGECKA
jgi:hypothetical protein